MRKLFQLVGEISVTGLEALNTKMKTFDSDTQKAMKQIDKLGKSISKVGIELSKNLTVPLMAFGVAAFKGVQAASDLNETISNSGELFGSSNKDILAWSETAAKGFGQSKQQAIDAAATFAIFGRSAGKSGGDLVQFSTKFTELASDLASFNNTSPEEAITAIGAAMRGEMEPIRKYGVLLDDMSMRNTALKMGIISSTKEALTPQQKVLAASELILKQTSAAQGDFARTSGGLANQQRILLAEIKNIAVEFGTSFLPIALKVTDALTNKLIPAAKSVIDWFNKLPAPVKETAIFITAFAAAIGPVTLVIGKLIPLLKILPAVLALCRGGMIGLNAAIAANPIGIFITVVTLGIAVGIALVRNWDFVKEKLIGAWDAIVYGTQQSISFIKQMFFSYIKMYVDGLALILQFVPGVNSIVKSAQNGLSALIEKEKESQFVRKELRAETEAYKEALKNSKSATEQVEGSEKKLIATQNDQVVATQAQIDAAKKLAEDRKAFEDKWTMEYFNAIGDREAALTHEYLKAYEEAVNLGEDVSVVEKVYSEKFIALRKEGADKSNKISEEKADAINESERSTLKEYLSITNQKSTLLEIEKNEAIENAKKVGASTTNIYKTYAIKQRQLAAQQFSNMANTVGNYANQVNQVFAGMNENRMQEIDNETKTKTQAISDTLLSEQQLEAARLTMSEASYAALLANEQKKKDAIKKLEEDAEKQKLELRKKAAQREKAASIFSIILQTAVAIMAAMSQLGPIAGAIAGVLIAALGAAQIAVVASKPIPMAKGGIVKSGTGGTVAQIGEGNQDEIVIPLKTGMAQFVDTFIDRVKNVMPSGNPFGQMALAGAGGGMSKVVNHYYQVGTLIGDDRGFKELERKLAPIRTAESQRLGGV